MKASFLSGRFAIWKSIGVRAATGERFAGCLASFAKIGEGLSYNSNTEDYKKFFISSSPPTHNESMKPDGCL